MVRIMALALLGLGLLSDAAVAGQGTAVTSWYGEKWTGRTTASGERFDHRQLTAASRNHPMGTRLLVVHGDRHVIVRINDRGPFVGRRTLDLSEAAASRLGIREQGVARVSYQVLR